MEDPVKGAGRMITDASGVTTREGGISSTGSTMFKDNNGIKASRPPQIPDIRDILDVFPQSLRESLVNKISDAIDYGKRKLTAVCSHQTRIGNLDAHLI